MERNAWGPRLQPCAHMYVSGCLYSAIVAGTLLSSQGPQDWIINEAQTRLTERTAGLRCAKSKSRPEGEFCDPSDATMSWGNSLARAVPR